MVPKCNTYEESVRVLYKFLDKILKDPTIIHRESTYTRVYETRLVDPESRTSSLHPSPGDDGPPPTITSLTLEVPPVVPFVYAHVSSVQTTFRRGRRVMRLCSLRFRWRTRGKEVKRLPHPFRLLCVFGSQVKILRLYASSFYFHRAWVTTIVEEKETFTFFLYPLEKDICSTFTSYTKNLERVTVVTMRVFSSLVQWVCDVLGESPFYRKSV